MSQSIKRNRPAMSQAMSTDASSSRSSSGQSSIGSANSKEFFINEIPQSYREKLCVHLDDLNIWLQLAKLMQLSEADVQTIRRKQALGNSPTDELLKIWGHIYNHTATELFILLYKERLYPAMRIIKNFVPYKFHVLVPSSKPAISELLIPVPAVEQSKKLLNCSSITISSNDTKDNNSTSTATSATSNAIPQRQESTLLSERSVKEYASSNLEINYEELSIATDNWNERNILGKGGFGTVYKGYWKHTDVAIKQIHYRAPNGCENIKVQIQQSLNELKYLNSFRHDNVLPLYGYSIRGEKPCLVYQFMRGGCLDKRLYTKSITPLTFNQRIEISLGTARGINYIHTHTPDKPLIHGDIKPANVLLDQCLMPKIGDFGLAREGPNAIKMAVEVTQVFGTKCYLPPEFLNSKKLSTQVDTYSFGVTLLETFTGQRAYHKNREIHLLTEYVALFCNNPSKNITDLLDPTLGLQTQQQLKICCEILALGLHCTAKHPQDRPEMEDVLKALSRYC